MPTGFEIVRFSAEELSTDPAQVDPQNITPNDAMVFHQTVRSCTPEAVTEDDRFEIRVEYKEAVTWEPKVASLELSLGELRSRDPGLLHKGTAMMTCVEALQAYRGDLDVLPWTQARPAALEAIELARTFNRHDGDLDEIQAALEAL